MSIKQYKNLLDIYLPPPQGEETGERVHVVFCVPVFKK